MTQTKLYYIVMISAILLPYYLNILYFGELRTGKELSLTAFIILFLAIIAIFIHYITLKKIK